MQRFATIIACLAALALTAPLQAQKADSAAKVTTRTPRTHHPKGATAKCSDGTYSMSESATGSCSGHGGVAKWYAKARCTDGTLWMHSSKRGACSGHQGVAEWLQNKKSTT